MRYGSVCSGIEAATQAWHPLGWTPAFFSEIEKFPSAVLAHHYGSNMPGDALTTNGVPNLGDMTKFEEWPDYAIDLLVGGTPCQSFSVAGLRKGLDDPRGNLMLTFGAIAQRYRPSWVVWENVPGVLSDDGGRGFASLLGLLSGRRIEVPHDGWRNAGVVPGYQGAYGLAWRVLDAQYIRVDGFGRAVPQRRRRVFVVGYLGDWRRAAAVLLEREGLRGDSPPRREAGESSAARTGFGITGSVTQGYGAKLGTDESASGNDIAAHIDPVASCVTRGYAQRLDWETENFVAHTLKGEGFDASEDGTGRGTPLVPVVAKTLTRGAESAGEGGYAGRRQEDDDNLVAYPLTSGMAASAARMPHEQGALLPIAIQAGALRENPNSGPDGVGVQEGISYTLEARSEVQAVAYGLATSVTPKFGVDISPTLTVPSPSGGGQPAAVAYDMRGREGGAQFEGPHETANIRAASGGSSRSYVAQTWAVRRLTPRECERLQGFPDDYTNVPYRGKPAADGPRYKALGNSMAVNVMRWIGTRIEMVEDIMKDQAA